MLKNTLTHLRHLGFLTTALTLALIANFAYGAWSNPTVAPTGGNTPAPINVGTDNQLKDGAFDANLLAVSHGAPTLRFFDHDYNDFRIHQNNDEILFQRQLTDGSWRANMRFHAADNDDITSYYTWFNNAVWSNEYCDGAGNNCFTPSTTGPADDEGENLDAGWFFTCPAGWIDTGLTDNDSRDGPHTHEDNFAGGGTVRLCVTGGGISDARWYPSCPAGWVDTGLSDCDGLETSGHDVNEDSCGDGGGNRYLCLESTDLAVEWFPVACPGKWVTTHLFDPDSGDGRKLEEDSGDSGGYGSYMCLGYGTSVTPGATP